MLEASRSRFAVLHIATEPCPEARALVSRERRSTDCHLALHRLASITVLSGFEFGGALVVEELRTASQRRYSEPDLIGELDRLLPGCSPQNQLVTYGGANLPFVMLRACSHWMIPLRNVAAWNAAPASQHIDLHRDVWSSEAFQAASLGDIAAALGLSIRSERRRKREQPRGRQRRYKLLEREGRAKVAAIFLAYASYRSFMSGNDLYLLSAWTALGDLSEQELLVVDPKGKATAQAMIEAARRATMPG